MSRRPRGAAVQRDQVRYVKEINAGSVTAGWGQHHVYLDSTFRALLLPSSDREAGLSAPPFLSLVYGGHRVIQL